MKTGLANILYFFSTSPVLSLFTVSFGYDVLRLFGCFVLICVEMALDGILGISRALNFH